MQNVTHAKCYLHIMLPVQVVTYAKYNLYKMYYAKCYYAKVYYTLCY